MNSSKRTSGLGAIVAFFSFLLFGGIAGGQYRDDTGDIRQTVARVSFLTGDVSYARGDDPNDWQPADYNVPVTIGDRLYAGSRGRAELQVHGGFTVRMGSLTDLAALNLTDETKQWSLQAGSAAFQLRRLGPDEIFEVDTPNAAVTFEREGDYRVDVDRDGNTHVTVQRGRALVAAGGGQVPLRAGDTMDIDGLDSPRYDVFAKGSPDAFDGWVRDRERRSESSRSRQYVQEDIVGVADLDESGRWQSIPSYGMVWTPTRVETGWQPYRSGHWIWQDPWGWTWVAAERWGWAPYHYGRWVNYSSRWWWVPVAPRERSVSYAPALVAFSGGGPGSSFRGDGFVGWFPLAPRDPFFQWWGSRRSVNVSNVTYVNRTYITVVNQNTFVSGGNVSRDWVRDRSVVSTMMRAPVLGGPLPIVPTSASLRVAVRSDLPPVARPPQAHETRTVVVRAAPPPPPPTFQAKIDVIQKNNGAPVAPAEAARLSESGHGSARPVVVTRSVSEDHGRVTFAPKSENSQQPHPEPVTFGRGRAAAPETAPPSAPTGGTPASAPDRGRQNDIQRREQPTPPPPPTHPPSAAPMPDRGRQPDIQRREQPAPPPPPPPTQPPSAAAPMPDRGRRPDAPPPREEARPAPTAVPHHGQQQEGEKPKEKLKGNDKDNKTPTPKPS